MTFIMRQFRKTRQFLHLLRLLFAETILPNHRLQRLNLKELDEDLARIILATVDDEVSSFLRPKWHYGNNQQAQRLEEVAELCLERYEGDILEIGCHEGRMTSRFARIAQKHGRRVIALDPWILGTQNISGNEYENFLAAIEPYRESVDIIRASSLDSEAIAQVKQRELAFVWVDGLHTYNACLKDIQTAQHCHGYIGVDDVIWSKECEVATMRGARLINRQAVHHPLCREAYLLPKP